MAITEDELKKIIGFIGMEEYTKADPSSQAGIRRWAERVREMDDAAFLEECVRRGQDGLESEAARGTDPNVYARLYGCMEEARTRHMANGHDRRCSGEPIYRKATAILRQRYGYEPDEVLACDCGAGA